MKVFFIFFTCLMILHQSSGQTFEGNGYKDVVVSISPDVSPDKQQDVVDNLKVRVHPKFSFSFDPLKPAA